MKTYIFIVRRICNITGAQQYVYNKTQYLKNQGWRVLIFSSLRGTVLIDEFKEYQDLIFPALYFSPYYYRKGEVNSTIDRIIQAIGDCEGKEIIIESDSFARSVWGELVASRLNCRHLAFLVQEDHNLNEKSKQFLLFKYNRHELAGIAKESLRQMFGGEVKEREDTIFHAYCNNVIEDCPDRYSEMLDKDADYTLASLGRLVKLCVPEIINAMYAYAKSHDDKKYNIVMIGGPLSHRNAKFAYEKLGSCSNVNLIMTGDMYPVPLSFAERIDVFISTAGSATATYRAGCPTVKVNPLNGQPVGVLGLGEGMASKTMYDSNSDSTIEEYIDKAIKERSAIIYSGGLGDEYYRTMHKEFGRQLNFLRAVSNNEYYNGRQLMGLKVHSHYPNTLLWALGHISGGFLTCIMRIMKK